MELLEGIETRRSWRAYKPLPIPPEILRKILQTARNSPSYTNTQPWEVVVVTSADKRAELGKVLFDLAESHVPPTPDLTAPAEFPPVLAKRRADYGAKRFAALGVERNNPEQRRELRLKSGANYGAPCAIFLFTDATLGTWSIFDCGLFVENIILAAHSFGLGCCPQAQPACNYPDAVRKCLGIPNTKRLIVSLSMGYPDLEDKMNSFRSDKAGLDEFVKWYT